MCPKLYSMAILCVYFSAVSHLDNIGKENCNSDLMNVLQLFCGLVTSSKKKQQLDLYRVCVLLLERPNH